MPETFELSREDRPRYIGGHRKVINGAGNLHYAFSEGYANDGEVPVGAGATLRRPIYLWTPDHARVTVLAPERGKSA